MEKVIFRERLYFQVIALNWILSLLFVVIYVLLFGNRDLDMQESLIGFILYFAGAGTSMIFIYKIFREKEE
jgi:hypothetical protein